MAQPRQQQPRRQAGAQDDEVHEPGPPDPVVPVEQVGNPDQPEPMREGDITTMDSLMGTREIEVDPIREPGPLPVAT